MAAANPTSPMPALPGNVDPLAELRDIHLPAPVDSWPAPGWWLLGILALLATAWLLRLAWRTWQQRRYRSDALAQLQSLRTDYETTADAQRFLAGVSELLKRVALASYPRAQIAALSGEAWVAFLDTAGGTREFTMGAGQVLIQGPYQPVTRPGGEKESGLDIEALHRLGARWIRQHRRGPAMGGEPGHA